MSAILGAWAGAIGDLFGRPLRGLLIVCALGAAALLSALVWAVVTFVLPSIPEPGGWLSWLDNVGEVLGGAGLVVVAVLLYPVVALILGGVLFDVAAERVEKLRFPQDKPGRFLNPLEGLLNGLKIAGPALLLNLLALPLVFIPFVNVVVFALLNAFLMGREYFSLAALRHGDWDSVNHLRVRAPLTIFCAALPPAILVSLPTLLPIAPFLIPVVALVSFPAPLLGAAIMVRLHKALAR
jgi:CysZ protein